jgi:choline-sulfatase
MYSNFDELPASTPTFVHNLRRGGYKTVLSGKMHFIGPDQLHGFEERLTTDVYTADFLPPPYWPDLGDPPRLGIPFTKTAFPDGKSAPPVRPMAQILKESGPALWSYQLEYDEEVQFRALERLRRLARRRGEASAQPWFMCVSFTNPHDPYVAANEYWDRYDGVDIPPPAATDLGPYPHTVDLWTRAAYGIDLVDYDAGDICRSRRGYFANVSYVDDKVGELIRELDRLGQLDETIVLFTSDHGDQVGEHGLWGKGTCREWSTRVPLIVAGPGIARQHKVRQSVSLVDLYPTLVELARLDMPEGEFSDKLSGTSLAPFLRGEQRNRLTTRVHIDNNSSTTIKPIRALLENGLKLVYVHDRPGQLFDLTADPNETSNVIDSPDYASVAEDLSRCLLSAWDPAETERSVLSAQRLRKFLSEALEQGIHTPWDFQPEYDASTMWVRRTSGPLWDPDIGC